ncbi:MAG: alpha-glycosidase [Clostridiales bacterium]|nr:alpha-glycosidase [Clostridiales bacterium]
MNIQAFYHEPKSKYAYSYNEKTLHIRFKSAKNDLSQVEVIAFDPYSYVPNDKGEWTFDSSKRYFIEMAKEHSDELYDYWFCEIDQINTLRIRYAFTLKNKETQLFYGPYLTCNIDEYHEISEIGSHYFNFPYINIEDVYRAPEWVESSIWYQIYPERFNRSEDGPKLNNLMKWDTEKVVDNSMVFGGNLHGIIEKLDYIQKLGVTGIYFTPIFESPSTHKYDTTDYFKIDPSFGDNETLGMLVEEAHQRGIKVMLDGVFNHCGYYHPFWQDVLEKGIDSEYYDCFYINGDEVNIKDEEEVFSEPCIDVINGLNYRIFGTAPYMPKWNTANQIAREHLISVGTYWIDKYDIDGWRLDVSNEVSHDFWREFRKAVKKSKPDAYIIGENWDNSYPWVAGDQFDGVMNYELLNVILNFIGVQDIREKYGVEKFSYQLGKYMVNYPKNIIPYMFNMVDSHDTARVLTVCGKDKRKALLVYLLQFIMPGSPSLLYGSEVGLEGNFESARGCMVFDELTGENVLYKFLKELITFRNKHVVFRSMDYSIEWIDQDKNSLLIKKTEGNDELLILINNSHEKHLYSLNDRDELVEIESFSFLVLLNGNTILKNYY